MKSLKPIILVLLFSFSSSCGSCWGQEKGIVCLGNGEMCVYQDQSDIIQLFGPPYSSPSVLELFMTGSSGVVSVREKGTAIRTHSITKNGKETGLMTDFVTTRLPAFIRSIHNTDTITFSLKLPEKTEWLDQTAACPAAIKKMVLLTSPAGAYAYQNIFYPTSVANNYHLIISGDISLSEDGNRSYTIRCLPGKSSITVVSGKNFPECVTNTEKVLSYGYDRLLAATRKDWNAFTSSRIDFEKKLPPETPEREKLLKAIDDVAVLIKAQQGKEGGVLAGYNYHLAYIRDQYGVSRGLLKLGHFAEAKAILQFYREIWQRKGLLRNAQGVGLDAFHVHENDEVEITGYLIIQAFDYLNATDDRSFVRELFPMLQWAWDCQVRNLFRNMLPFNGDETYIAGGILPRTVLFDGSAEATLLFVTGGRQLVAWAEKNNMWEKSVLDGNRELLQKVISDYSLHFLKEGKLLTNNPDRKKGLELPRFRHGVCESCFRLEWTQKTPNNRYLCPHCFPEKTLPNSTDGHFFLQSVSLMPWYVNSDLIADSQVTKMIEEIIDLYTSTGKFPSRPDGNRTVGYDYGLFLYSLTRMNHPLKDKIYRQMLDVIDDSGAWVEYYENNVPSGTLCRPWESAINIEAAINYVENLNSK
ncbi:MAG: hypothetical protein LBL57_05300 [Tannerella sp.]|jgi:hypothetical protein|nr:hypothetical protein [Tannerella sp.]